MTKGVFYIVREDTANVEAVLGRLVTFDGPVVILWVGSKGIAPEDSRLNRVFYYYPVQNAVMHGPIMTEPMIDDVAQTVCEVLLKNAGCKEFVNALTLADNG